jgi:dimethylaniline monooxygenase (N-oxide forming)
VVKGRIEPVRGELAEFYAGGVRLRDGTEIACDMVVASIGSPPPRFPFLPDRHRALLEGEPDGAQLYRHLLHPRIPRLAFAGFNHGFLHVPGVEVSMLWLDGAAARRPGAAFDVAEMEASIAAVRAWKREHMLFEPSRSCGVNTRFHQYIDVLLADLGLRAHRKANALAGAHQPVHGWTTTRG